MANFYQQGQHVHGAQVNSEFADLRGATFGDTGQHRDSADVLKELNTILDAMRKATEMGLVDRSSAAVVTKELDAAMVDLRGGTSRAAADRLEKAIKVLQAAAPIATIAGTLTSVWGSLSGTAL
jgi:hypothetical protein